MKFTTDNKIPVRYIQKPAKEVRCTGKNCTRLLGYFSKADGQIKCPKCNHLNNVSV